MASKMSFDSLDMLPPELILELSLFLQLPSLVALVCSAKRYAQLLTPQLYTRCLQIECENQALPCCYHIWHWSSPYAVEYFQKFPSGVSQVLCCGTLLHQFARAGNLCLVKVILSRGADVNATTKLENKTPLHIAAGSGDADIVQALIEAGADITAKDSSSRTPLQIAIRGGHLNVVLCLLKTGPGVFEGRLTALEGVLYHDALDIFEPLLRAIKDAGLDINARDISGNTVLHTASWKGYKSPVQLLLASGADPLCMNPSGNTALHMACSQGHAEVATLLIRAMRAAGGDPFIKNTSGLTPLHKAIASCRDSVVRLLCDSGADVSVVDDNGFSTIQRALVCPDSIFNLLCDHGPAVWPSDMLRSRLYHETGEMARLKRANPPGLEAMHRILNLIKSGRTEIDLLMRTASNSTPLNEVCHCPPIANLSCFAIETCHTIRAFIAAGADVDIPDDEGRTPIHTILCSSAQHKDYKATFLMLETSRDLNMLSNHGDSYLHEAARYGHLRTVQLLVRKMTRDRLFAINNDGWTALHCATEQENTSIIEHILATDIDLNIQDRQGRTALHLASASSSGIPAVELLIDAGADPSILDNAGSPPVHYALAEHHLGIADLLIERCDARHTGCLDCTEYITYHQNQLGGEDRCHSESNEFDDES